MALSKIPAARKRSEGRHGTLSEENPHFLTYMHQALEGLDSNLRYIRESAIGCVGLAFFNFFGYVMLIWIIWRCRDILGGGPTLLPFLVFVFLMELVLVSASVAYGVRMMRYYRHWVGKLKQLEELETRLVKLLGPPPKPS